MNLGSIALVGAGPGDPELLTIAALRHLVNPNALVVSDRLVSREIIALVAGELRVAGKRPGCAENAQQEIFDWVREGVLADREVVRLKIGDPFVFGRGGEEVIEFRESLGVEASVVPGVSSALAAPLAAGVPVTHRGAAYQLVICTGYGRDGSAPELPRYLKHQTVVLLMAVGRLRGMVESMTAVDREGGGPFPLDCPALVVERASTPRQRLVLGDLTDIADLVDEHKISAPAVVVLGHAVRALRANEPHGLVVGYDAPRARSATADLDLAAVLDYVDAAALAPDAELRAGSC